MYKGPIVMYSRVGIHGGWAGESKHLLGGIGTTVTEQQFLKREKEEISSMHYYFVSFFGHIIIEYL